jgi:hypothetical protein
MTNPIDDIVPRKLESGLENILHKFSFAIEDLVNFGSNVLKWDIENSSLKDEELPALLFLRNFIEQIDAISILIKASSIEPCKSLLRTSLENIFYIEYLLEQSNYNRAMSFLYWYRLNEKQKLKKRDGISDEYNRLANKFSKDKLLNNCSPPTIEGVDKLLTYSDSILNSEKYQLFKVEYERTKLKLKNNITWYSLFDGPKNIFELAERLNRHALYEELFKQFSFSTHGTDILKGKIKSNNLKNYGVSQIRNPMEAQNITKNCLNFCFIVFDIFIKHRIPTKQNDLNNLYLGLKSFNNELSQKEFIKVKKNDS